MQYSAELHLSDVGGMAASQVGDLAGSFGLTNLTSGEATAFQQQLSDIEPNRAGSVTLTAVQTSAVTALPGVSPAIYNLAFAVAANMEAFAGSGNDTITGAGGDTLHGSISPYGGAGLYAGAGLETLVAGGGADTLHGGSSPTAQDTLQGGSRSSHTLIVAGGGTASILGGEGTTTVQGGAGDATFQGGGGNATVVAGTGHETVYGGLGATTFLMSAAHFVDGDRFEGMADGGGTLFRLTDLDRNQVAFRTHPGHVATLEFGGATVTLTNVSYIEFSDDRPIRLS